MKYLEMVAMNEGFKETEIGLIPEEWDIKTLKDISEDVSYGYTTSATNDRIGPKFLRITDIVPSLINWDKVPFCKISDKNKTKYKLEMGDIVIARTGANTGFNAIFKEDLDAVFASYLIRFRMNPQKADPFFVSYMLQSKLWDFHVQGVIGGSAQPGANAKRFGEFKIPLPLLNEQKAIARVLSDLDRKIKLNHEMNQTLEAIGQAIFRHWFVHFEFPDSEGLPYKSRGGEMVNSELGEIPKGWEVRKLKDCVEIIIDHRGKTPTKLGSEWSSSGIPALSAKNVKNGKIVNVESIKFVNEELYSKWMREEIEREDILLTSEAPLGEFVSWDYDEKIVLSQRLFGIRANKRVMYPKYLYCFMNSGLFNYELKSRATGSTVQGIRQAELMKTNILIPPLKLTSQFQNLIEPLFNKITINEEESKNLSQIRNSLLPKLMSGKIRVKIPKEATVK